MLRRLLTQTRKCLIKLTIEVAYADPQSYWVEIIGQNDTDKTKDVKETDTGCYRMVCYTIFWPLTSSVLYNDPDLT